MNEIFGIPMNAIMVVLLILLAVCLATVAWVALRRPVIFKLGVRNIPRRKAQTILIVVGLMLSTMIIAAALGTGDTIDHSATAETYRSLGHADQLVVYTRSDDGEGNIGTALDEHIPQDLVGVIEQEFAGTDLVDGVLPVLIERVPVIKIENGEPTLSEPDAFFAGIDPSRVDQFGGLRSTDGDLIDLAATALDEVVISEELADSLELEAGSTIVVYYNNQPVPLRVHAVAENSPLSGKFDPSTPGLVVPLDRLQAVTGLEGQVTTIAVSNRGGVESGMDLTDEVSDRLIALFTGQPYGVDKIKQENIEFARIFASIFTTFFLVFGLFSIAVGILLIVLIFTMLAAERRSEMGMTRAVGAQRRQLMQQFVSEGTAYSLLAGVVGVALGVAAAYIIGYAVRPILGEFLTIEPKVSFRSMIVAYCLGVVITFLAVLASSWKISRLNVVAAVRDIPDETHGHRRLRSLIWGILLTVAGALSVVGGQASDSAFLFYFGMSLLAFSIAMILRYFGVPGRPVYTVVGLYLVVLWLLPPDVSDALFGTLNGNIEMFFLSGIFMVAGATVLIVQNLDLLLQGVSAIGGLFRSKLPAVRTAVAFPGAAKGRTGMTIAMFSLIIFSLVMFATINRNFTDLFTSDAANAGWDVRADSAGSNPIGDTDAFLQLLSDRGVDTSDITKAGQVSANFGANMRRSANQEWKFFPLVGMDERFMRESAVTFQQYAAGYADDAAVINALLTDPGVAVVSATALEENSGFGGDPTAFTLADPDGDGPERGLGSGDEGFEPITVQIQRPDGGEATVKVIAVIDSQISTLFGMYASQAFTTSVYENPTVISYFVALADPSKAGEKADAIERALVTNGVQGNSIKDELEESQRQSTGFLLIFQGFMGLGLIVGVAAVGVIAFRAVVERRQQIGVLRAIGYQQSLVSLSFMIETAFVVGMGVLSGTIMGLLLARNLFSSDEFSGIENVNFVIPWGIVVIVLIVTIVAALLMTWIPAKQASRLEPAEALRYE